MPKAESVPHEPGTVFVVDDDTAVRRAIRLALETIKVTVKTYATAMEFLRDYGQGAPGAIVLDVRLPDMGGMELLRRLSERLGYCPPVVVISGHGDIEMAVTALKLGAVDFVEKPFTPSRLIEQVQLALERDDAERSARNRKAGAKAALACLSDREREVLGLLLEGASNKEIAAKLGLSAKTASSHKTNIMAKMGAHSLVELLQALAPVKGNGDKAFYSLAG
jgi:FixJ family two-component response regulator